MTHMYDLTIADLPDGGIRLEQSAGSLEGPAIIDLHPMQVRLIAERAGLLNPSPATSWPRGFVRRLERIRKEAAGLADFLDSIPSFPSRAEPTEDVRRADELWTMLRDLMDDYSMTEPEVAPEPAGDAAPAEPQQGVLL